MFTDAATVAHENGVLVIDEHGDRKWGKKTAHVGKQWLGNLGKTDNGVVSVSSLWAEEGVYYPLEVEPYTPKHHFEKGKSDPWFRTKLKIAQELVQRSVAEGVPFRAVVADSFYGEDEDFRQALSSLGVGYVLALKDSHSWWHKEGTIGALWEAALAGGWKNAEDPGEWRRVIRTFRDGHQETWWALEVEAGPYSPKKKAHRALVVSTDPERLPHLSSWYLITNLPAPGFEEEEEEGHALLAPASVAEVVRLYGLRMWVEQSYKQVKHALGWSDYQVRSDLLAIRRHWQLVFCAFSFCWWASCAEELELGAPPGIVVVLEEDKQVVPPASTTTTTEGRGKKERAALCSSAVVAASTEGGKGVAGALYNAMVILEGVHRQGPARRVESIA
ncbi:MAG: IS701 family transposase [Actinobacteria bacterium]|nr:IS701 family transposase [Actinomycetota bacterium]